MSAPEFVTAESTLRNRRQAVKGQLLVDCAVFVQDSGDYAAIIDLGERLGLPPGSVESVVSELAAELWRRSGKYPRAAP